MANFILPAQNIPGPAFQSRVAALHSRITVLRLDAKNIGFGIREVDEVASAKPTGENIEKLEKRLNQVERLILRARIGRLLQENNEAGMHTKLLELKDDVQDKDIGAAALSVVRKSLLDLEMKIRSRQFTSQKPPSDYDYSGVT